MTAVYRNEWELHEDLKQHCHFLGEEARSRVMDTLREILKRPDAEEWDFAVGIRSLIVSHKNVEIYFDCEGYAKVTFLVVGCAWDVLGPYFAQQDADV
jgi:hypothetical protein